MTTVAERLTADAYLAREDCRRTELIDGVGVVNEPSVLRQRACALIWKVLDQWTATPGGGAPQSLPINVPLDEGNVLAPDVLWFERERERERELALNVNAPRAPSSPSRYARRVPGATTSGASASSTSATASESSGLPTPRAARCWSTAAVDGRRASTSRSSSPPKTC